MTVCKTVMPPYSHIVEGHCDFDLLSIDLKHKGDLFTFHGECFLSNLKNLSNLCLSVIWTRCHKVQLTGQHVQSKISPLVQMGGGHYEELI